MIHMTRFRSALLWALLAALAAALCVAAFRGYLSTEMLLNFANAVLC
jgi:hypothetical protein